LDFWDAYPNAYPFEGIGGHITEIEGKLNSTKNAIELARVEISATRFVSNILLSTLSNY
jgi:hypothetical protein